LNGTVEVGRPIEKIGAHCKGQNTGSIGIAYAGGVEEDGKTPKDTRTIEQKEMLRWLIDDLKKKYDFSDVDPHNKYSNKACPCFDVYSEEY
jgi:N-acetylmuramoyl-L-alanine amidase